MAVTFDGPNKLIIATTGTTTLDVQDVYSRWKDWMLLSDNAKFLPAFSNSVGGEPLGGGAVVGQYFFIQNGWRIRPQEADHTLNVVGNIVPLPDTADVFAPTVGTFQVLTNTTFSSLTQALETSSSGGGTPVADNPTLFIEEWGGSTVTAQGKASDAPKHRIAKTQLTVGSTSARTSFDFDSRAEFILITANAEAQFELGDSSVEASSSSYYIGSGQSRKIGLEEADKRIAVIQSQITQETENE